MEHLWETERKRPSHWLSRTLSNCSLKVLTGNLLLHLNKQDKEISGHMKDI